MIDRPVTLSLTLDIQKLLCFVYLFFFFFFFFIFSPVFGWHRQKVAAILSSTGLARVYYLRTLTTTNAFITGSEALHSQLVKQADWSATEEAASFVKNARRKEGGGGVMEAAREVCWAQAFAAVIGVAKKQIAAVPFSDFAGTLLEKLLVGSDEADQQKRVMHAASFSALAIAVGGGSDAVLECVARRLALMWWEQLEKAKLAFQEAKEEVKDEKQRRRKKKRGMLSGLFFGRSSSSQKAAKVSEAAAAAAAAAKDEEEEEWTRKRKRRGKLEALFVSSAQALKVLADKANRGLASSLAAMLGETEGPVEVMALADASAICAAIAQGGKDNCGLLDAVDVTGLVEALVAAVLGNEGEVKEKEGGGAPQSVLPQPLPNLPPAVATPPGTAAAATAAAAAQANPLQPSSSGSGDGGGGGDHRRGSVFALLDGLNLSGLKEGEVEEAALAISEGLSLDSASFSQEGAAEVLTVKDLKAVLEARGLGSRAGGVALKVRRALAESFDWNLSSSSASSSTSSAAVAASGSGGDGGGAGGGMVSAEEFAKFQEQHEQDQLKQKELLRKVAQIDSMKKRLDKLGPPSHDSVGDSGQAQAMLPAAAEAQLGGAFSAEDALRMKREMGELQEQVALLSTSMATKEEEGQGK
jgi:hypothetical protein